MLNSPHILIVGGASIDTLHLKTRTVTCPGGAGMYTSMAARRCGINVTMFSPQMNPLSTHLIPISESLTHWIGPEVSPNDFPRFEISYKNGNTEYLDTRLDAEADLTPDLLPQDLSIYDIVHLVPLSNAIKQLEFIEECKIRGAKKISAGTGFFIVKNQLELVKNVIEKSDYFFMNRLECESTFGLIDNVFTETGKTLFITDAEKGVTIVQGKTHSHISSYPSIELDPTGAGDTFCGATLSYLVRNNHPIISAQKGALLASKMIENIGPEELLTQSALPQIGSNKITLNEERIKSIAESLSRNDDIEPFDFINPDLPEKFHPFALDYFFIATLHQFGFWTESNNHYNQPMIASLNGTMKKGSDYLWRSFLNKLKIDPNFFTAKRQTEITKNELKSLFHSDSGENPIPAFDLHLELCQKYGEDMISLRLTPKQIIDEANSSKNPLTFLLTILDQISGYKEDPIRKKSNLLSVILNQRPEQFIHFNQNEMVAPIIDYHVMRSCLRMGLIEIIDEKLKKQIMDREIISFDDEWAVRYSSYLSFQKLVDLSGKSLGAIDIFFFHARKRCPEMTIPDCPNCLVEPVCAQKKELFQPVIRTSFY